MDDGPAVAGGKIETDPVAAAENALRRLQAGSRVWAGAVLGERDQLLAATGENEAWAEAAERLLVAADAAGQAGAAHVHVATADGEVFGVRGSTHTIVVVAPRFQLASLMLTDLRASLRRLEGPVRTDTAAASRFDKGTHVGRGAS